MRLRLTSLAVEMMVSAAVCAFAYFLEVLVGARRRRPIRP
jgi:hypothetical protein